MIILIVFKCFQLTNQISSEVSCNQMFPDDPVWKYSPFTYIRISDNFLSRYSDIRLIVYIFELCPKCPKRYLTQFCM